jgi:hypothetical protein
MRIGSIRGKLIRGYPVYAVSIISVANLALRGRSEVFSAHQIV